MKTVHKILIKFLLLWFAKQSLATEQQTTNIVLMGEQGVGKTSLLSTLYNLAKGIDDVEHLECAAPIVQGNGILRSVSLDQFRCYQDSQISDNTSSAESQTQKVLEYTFETPERIYRIFDTPGFSASADENDHIAELIVEVFEEYPIHAVILVGNPANGCRSTAAVKTFMDSLTSQCGLSKEAFSKNTALCATRCANSSQANNLRQLFHELNIDLESAPIFRFANDPVFVEPCKLRGNVEDIESLEKILLSPRYQKKNRALSLEQRSNMVIDKLKTIWTKNQGNFEEMKAFLEAIESPIISSKLKAMRSSYRSLDSAISKSVSLLRRKDACGSKKVCMDHKKCEINTSMADKQLLLKEKQEKKSQTPGTIDAKTSVQSVYNFKTQTYCKSDCGLDDIKWKPLDGPIVRFVRTNAAATTCTLGSTLAGCGSFIAKPLARATGAGAGAAVEAGAGSTIAAAAPYIGAAVGGVAAVGAVVVAADYGFGHIENGCPHCTYDKNLHEQKSEDVMRPIENPSIKIIDEQISGIESDIARLSSELQAIEASSNEEENEINQLVTELDQQKKQIRDALTSLLELGNSMNLDAILRRSTEPGDMSRAEFTEYLKGLLAELEITE